MRGPRVSWREIQINLDSGKDLEEEKSYIWERDPST